MSGIVRKLLFLRNKLRRRKLEPDKITEEKWIADFSKAKHARLTIKSDSSYDANLRKNLFFSGHSFVLSLKKTGCIAWVEAPDHRYRDLVISGTIRIDARGGYAAGGIMFRMTDDNTYYQLLVSSKGYFRLDVMRNGMPLALTGWTELPLFQGAALSPDESVDFSVIAFGSHIVILLRGRWAAEVNDSSILEGTICFAAASYEQGDPGYRVIREVKDGLDVSYTAEVFLESLTVESRISEVSVFYQKWRDSTDIDPVARLRLAETFTAMNQPNAALVQLRKGWEIPGHRRTQKELLLAGRLAQTLGLISEAESYISKCFEADVDSPEGKQALVEMAKILCAEERFAELKDYCTEAVKVKPDDPLLFTFQGHGFWNLKMYKQAAAAYDKAFQLDRKNGIAAKNAANVYEVMGRRKEAIARYIEAGIVFMQAGNYNDLGLLVPKLLSLGADNWEARSLAGKWAFGVEDWKMAEEEFARAESLRKSKRPKPKKDGAQVFLEALLLVQKGKRREAIPLFEEAAVLEKDFALFHFRLAENLYLLENKYDDPKMLKALDAALTLCREENSGKEGPSPDEGLRGWIHNFAAQVALSRGNLNDAARYLEKAGKVLGDVPAVRVNRGVLFYLQGSLDKALELLHGEKQDDPEGIMANCAGNLLVRSRRFEEADEKYRRALSAAPDNAEYLCNRASCLMELGLYGEADELLAKAHGIAPSPGILEMISYVAVKKGEYIRAEQACKSALEIDPRHAQTLLSLGWLLLGQGRQEECHEILRRLDDLELMEAAAKGREELRSKLDELVYKTVECALCERNWKILKDPPLVPALRLFAMPPDYLPAGSCPVCGKTYCIGCAKKNLDPEGRFICPSCDCSLKLANDGLKKIVHDWAARDGLLKKADEKREKKEAEEKTKPSKAKKTAKSRSKAHKPKEKS